MPRNPNSLANLVQNNPKYSEEQKLEWARNAAAKAAELRRQRKSSMELMRAVLSRKLDDPELAKKLQELGLDDTFGAGIALAQARRALSGDTEASRYCRDTAGDKPTEALQLSVTDKPIRSMDLTQLSDDELEALADRADADADAGGGDQDPGQS